MNNQTLNPASAENTTLTFTEPIQRPKPPHLPTALEKRQSSKRRLQTALLFLIACFFLAYLVMLIRM
jgi:hypothetical protein